MFVVHLAGLDVVVLGRFIQRCAICGAKLADSGAVKVGMTEAGDPDWPGRFEPQTLVAEKEGVFCRVHAPDNFYPPQGGCLSLVEGD